VDADPRISRIRAAAILIIATAIGISFVGIGIQHFRNPEPFEAIVPAYLGWPRFWNFTSGGLEILLGLGLIVPIARRWSARFLVLLVLAMSLANLNMWMNDVPFGGTRLSTAGHVVRGIAQIVLLTVLALLGGPWRRGASRRESD
jgi:uncharacterized membrane protein